jgi:hypothetical protein
VKYPGQVGDPAVPELWWLLRSWRKTTPWSADEIANALSERFPDSRFSEQAVWSWERPPERRVGQHSRQRGGEREPRYAELVLGALDDIYGAKGALDGLASTLETPIGLPSMATWWHNYPAESGPVWTWIRPQASKRVNAVFVWGPARLSLNRPCPASGIILSCPLSTDNPPLRVDFSGGRGWVDFGIGIVPPSLGIPVINALRLIRPADVNRLLRLNRATASGDIRQWLGKRPYLVGPLRWITEHEPEAVDERRGFTDLREAATSSIEEDCFHFTGPQLRSLRNARRMPRGAVARRASELGRLDKVSNEDERSDDFNEHHLSRIESTGRAGRARYIRARLDTTYRADGLTFRERVRECELVETKSEFRADDGTSLPRTYDVTFPSFWIGPVWLHFSADRSSGAEALVEMEWPPWRRSLMVKPGTTVWTRRSKPDDNHLTIRLKTGWFVVVGMGRYLPVSDDRNISDINGDWVALGNSGTDAIFRQMLPVYEQAITAAHDRAVLFIRGFSRFDSLYRKKVKRQG